MTDWESIFITAPVGAAGALRPQLPPKAAGNFACLRTSALSQLNFRVNRLQFRSGVVDLHLPVYAALCGIHVGGPSVGFFA
jgi:hypothetical protein